MASQQTKNDKAWEELFVERNIVRDVDNSEVHSITATSINTKREARLMTKFDHIINLPKIFSDNGLSILPNSRSSYIIGRFDCYARLPEPSGSIIEKTFPNWMQSLSSENLYSEASALLCAQHAGLIADILEEDEIDVELTVFGRMSTGEFDFSICKARGPNSLEANWPISVDRAQCEIDGGFESSRSFAIVEVKNQVVTDFHVRQLYYPYRLWANKLNKPVIPIFLTYSNEVFSFYVYDFADTHDYSSLQLVRQKRYQIVPTEIEISDIRRLLAQTRPVAEISGIPFPQADKFERVIDFLTRLAAANGTLTQDEETTNYAFDLRQTQYYTNAGQYLGLVERSNDEFGVRYSLTTQGTQLMNKAPRARNLALVEAILLHSVFRKSIEYYLDNSQKPPNHMVVYFIREAGLQISGKTQGRRAQTVRSWIDWIMNLTAEG